jgi:methylthioribose-1-phosphate isomerase
MSDPTRFRLSVEWFGDHIEVIDQTLLPEREEIWRIDTVEGVVDAIRRLVVRGAPAIGVCGAFGVVLGLQQAMASDASAACVTLQSVAATIAAARPTAVDLPWAVRRTAGAAVDAASTREMIERAEAEALAIQAEGRESCRLIGEYGRTELAGVTRIMTHCNTGRLATSGWGTALGVVYAKAEAGEPVEVLASETRPLLQGARLTAWELLSAGIPVTLMTDSMSGAAMATGRVEAVVVGCDRVARNGDTANKIGTYTHALVAHAHQIPFYVAGPLASFDPDIASGREIVIEERPASEVLTYGGRQVAATVPVWNPAFDVTPAELITAFITDHGVLRPPYEESITRAFARASARDRERWPIDGCTGD